MKKAFAAVVVAAGLLALLAGPLAAQCVMCKTALTGSAEGRGISGQFNRAILLMVAAPYVVMGSFLVALFRGPIRERGARLRTRLLVGLPRRPAATRRAAR